jgi:hypothetical protein
MSLSSRWLAFVLAPALLFIAPDVAAARPVKWAQVEVRSGDDAGRVAANLKSLLKKASEQVKWGKGDKLELSARVTKLDWEKNDDVLRVSVTVVAKIAGGKSARSHIRIGGRVNERRDIEKEALKIVADGLVTRLSDMARQQ